MLTVKEATIDRLTETFYHVLNGKAPEAIPVPDGHSEDEIGQLVTYFNRFLEEYREFAGFMSTTARGELDFGALKSKMSVVNSYKSLLSNLKHLTWKTQQIAGGDFTQKVDFMGDFSSAFNSMSRQLKEAFEKIEAQNKALQEANEIISREKEKSEKLLLNILPVEVTEDLKKYGKSDPRTFEGVTVYFSDIAGFTNQSSKIEPKVLIGELNEMFTVFDQIMEENHCERIKTIGDAYLAVCGMPTPNPNHAVNMANAALAIRDYMCGRQRGSIQWKIRIGIHSGNVVGGVVGIKKYIYDVFGDTINTASRMESNGEPMKINISQATRDLLGEAYACETRDPIEVKGKGAMNMYFLSGTSPGSLPDGERRKHARIPLDSTVTLRAGEKSVACVTENVGVDGGILLRVRSPSQASLGEERLACTLQVCMESESRNGIPARLVRNYREGGSEYFALQWIDRDATANL